MKKWINSVGVVLVFLSLLTVLSAQNLVDTEKIVLSAGSFSTVDLPFEMRTMKVADPKIVKAEVSNKKQLRLTGLQVGSTDVQVMGESGLSRIYNVVVTDNIREELNALRRDLDSVPEVDVSVNQDRIVLKGEISKPSSWDLFQRVLASMQKPPLNLVRFRPAPEAVLSLRDILEKLGYKIITDNSTLDKPGMLSLKLLGDGLLISGSVFSPAHAERVKSVLAAQTWLSMDKGKGDGGRIPVVWDVEIEPKLIEVGVVFVEMSSSNYDRLGVNLLNAGLGTLDAAVNVFGGRNDGNRPTTQTYTISSGLRGTLEFLATSGSSRQYNAGHLTFRSNDTPDWRMLKCGGTLKVKVASNDTASLEDIDYGLIIKVKGGLRTAQMVELDLQLELSSPSQNDSGDWDVRGNSLNTAVQCEFGKTLVLGGMRSLVEGRTSPTGVPFLRSVPGVKWFFSEQESTLTSNQVLILVSPVFAGEGDVILPTVSDETRGTLEDAQKPLKETDKEKRKGKRWFFF
ncbi:MAG: pilus assembly protein N-terminal domain-containing protein [Lentisphaeria bacterium]